MINGLKVTNDAGAKMILIVNSTVAPKGSWDVKILGVEKIRIST